MFTNYDYEDFIFQLEKTRKPSEEVIILRKHDPRLEDYWPIEAVYSTESEVPEGRLKHTEKKTVAKVLQEMHEWSDFKLYPKNSQLILIWEFFY